MDTSLQLYVKPGCPWCAAAKKVLTERGFAFQEIDVLADSAAYATMERLSGQRLTPTLLVGDKLLADFGPEDLVAFLEKEQLEP